MISIVPSLPNPVLVEQANLPGGNGSQAGSNSGTMSDSASSYQSQMQNLHGRNGAERGVPPPGTGGSEFQDARNAYSTQGNGGSNGNFGGAPPPNADVTGGNSEFQSAKNDYTVAGSGNGNGASPPPPEAPAHNSEASLISISDIAKEMVASSASTNGAPIPAENAAKGKAAAKPVATSTPIQPDSSSQAVLLAMSQLTPPAPAAVSVKPVPALVQTTTVAPTVEMSSSTNPAVKPGQIPVSETQMVEGTVSNEASKAAGVSGAATQSPVVVATASPAGVSSTSVAQATNPLTPKTSGEATTTNPTLVKPIAFNPDNSHIDAVVVNSSPVQASQTSTATGNLSAIQRMQALTGSTPKVSTPVEITAATQTVQSVPIVQPEAAPTPIKVQVPQDTKGVGSSTVTDTLLGTGVTVVQATQSKSETGSGGSNEKQGSQPDAQSPVNPTESVNPVNGVPSTSTLTQTSTVNGVTATAAVPNSDQMKVINQISAHVDQLRAQSGGGVVTIHLNPSNLGTVQITMSQTKDGIVAHMIASSDTARQALQAGNHTLNASLEQRGLKLQSLNVDLNSAGGNAMNYQTPQQQAGLYQQPSQMVRPMNSQFTSADTSADVPLSAVNPLTTNSLLDYRV